MNITIDQYILNPLLQKGRVLSALMRETVRRDYTDRFNKINLRENNQWNYTQYYDEKNNQYYIHIKVPSEAIKNFYYDVVFKFYTDASVEEAGTDLGKYYFQVFANDPAFCYTYAYVFLHNDLIIPDLKSKISKQAATEAPNITNPMQETGYVKSIYFAYLLMKNRGLLRKINWMAVKPYNSTDLFNSVEDMDTKVAKREDEQKRLEASKKKQKETRENNQKHHEARLNDTEKQNMVRKTKVSKNTVKTVGTTKSKNVRKSKIIK